MAVSASAAPRSRPPEEWWSTARGLAKQWRSSELVIPTSDTVVLGFEEDAEAARREAEWAARRVDTVRVAQTGLDTKGALYSRRFYASETIEEWRDLSEGMASEHTELRDTIPYGTRPHGFRDDTGAGFGIVYSSAAALVDDVRVLTDTVLVRDGVLRGLVRNWSRTLWAYGVAVTADGRSWHWPLSVQPGEVAPFEIDGWDGPADRGPRPADAVPPRTGGRPVRAASRVQPRRADSARHPERALCVGRNTPSALRLSERLHLTPWLEAVATPASTLGVQNRIGCVMGVLRVR